MSSIISFVGNSNSGKTTLLVKLIGELKRRGYKLAVIKHCSGGFDLDQPGKDSWKFARAGSNGVMLSSSEKVALIKNMDHEATLDELLGQIEGEFDLIIVEGFKGSEGPKIEVYRSGNGDHVCPAEDLIAVVSDETLDIEVPRYSSDEIEALADFIEKRIINSVDDSETVLFINDIRIPLNTFAREILSSTLLGMVSALRGVDEVKTLRISLRRGLG